MKRHLYLLVMGLLLLTQYQAQAATKLYSKAFGKAQDPAIIFLHGGPGYNAATFEIGAAQALADKGYYVIVYDQRGCARSKDPKAKYTFAEAVKDLDGIYKTYKVKKAALIGHSFGGAVALHYADAHPEKVRVLMLVGAPLDYPATFNTIRARCRAYYEAKGDPALSYIAILDTMDQSRLDYATYCFAHAMSCGLYKTQAITPEAAEIFRAMGQDPAVKTTGINTLPPVKGFYAQHRYTTQDHYDLLGRVMDKVSVYGIFGDEDGLFDGTSLQKISDAITPEHFFLVKGASHSVFLDQRSIFIGHVQDILRQVPQ